MSIIDEITIYASLDPQTTNILVALIAAVASILGARMLSNVRERRAQDNSKTDQQQVAVDVLVKTYEQSIKNLEADRDWWKDRAIKAEQAKAESV